jgi:hypothetical protein
MKRSDGVAAVSKNRITCLSIRTFARSLMIIIQKWNLELLFLLISTKDFSQNTSLFCGDTIFMTLSFMSLFVIPALELIDKGLFDGMPFDYVDKH